MQIDNNKIAIVSGEGEIGHAELYNGKKTARALKSRLTRERCNGDRWAKAIQYEGINKCDEPFGIDLETGEPCSWPLNEDA